MKPDEIMRWLLSWSLMCCSIKPPLYPTTTCILLLTALRGECTFGGYLREIKCTITTIRVQVHRLHKLGLLDVKVELRNHRNRKVYRLTPQGLSMVYAWVGKTSKTFKDL